MPLEFHKIKGGGGGRAGQAGEVASTRGGRQAHPPIAAKVIYNTRGIVHNEINTTTPTKHMLATERVRVERGRKKDKKIHSLPVFGHGLGTIIFWFKTCLFRAILTSFLIKK